ncbi:MAG: hypothetical protein Q9191_002559 [Dirinaria sp. TL-2023a]
MAGDAVAPVLSTPATHIFEEDSILHNVRDPGRRRSDESLTITYEIERTVAEIRAARCKRIALQFPDEMLPDAPRISELLRRGLKKAPSSATTPDHGSEVRIDVAADLEGLRLASSDDAEARPYILGDTSYGACCVDEIAAEHIGADIVVHYGRSCLSPTARLPVIYVFTKQLLDVPAIIQAFVDLYPEKGSNVIITGDISCQYCLADIQSGLIEQGYDRISIPDVLHDPSSLIPNRSLPAEVQALPESLRAEKLEEWDIFHISSPPEALLLTLSSRVRNIYICPPFTDAGGDSKPVLASTARALRKRYALLTSVTTTSIFGILINTLSVQNYMHIVSHVKSQIHAAGKKSYVFVVGKINAAKIANFDEVGAWVVVGCWESSLIESKDFWKPVLTPFELELALKRDHERIWTGEWRSSFQEVLDEAEKNSGVSNSSSKLHDAGGGADATWTEDARDGDDGSEEESEPPEYDLRTGRYVSHSRPMKSSLKVADATTSHNGSAGVGNALIKRAKGELAVIGGETSPGAEFLRTKRTWKGLGSDFEIAYDEGEQSNGALVQEGRNGIARGYVHGESSQKA